MTRLKPPEAIFTLFHVPRVWGKGIFEGLSRKQSGDHRSLLLAWSPLFSSISMMFMLTLSSSVVVSKEVVLQEEPQLQRYVADQGSSNASAPIKLSPVQDTYLHTIGSFIFNVSGSIWVSDSCMIVPYEIPWEIEDTGRLGDQTWRAETNAFNIDYGYVPMVMTGKTSLNISYDVANIPDALANNTTRNSKSLGFKTCSEDSCKIQLQIPIDDQYLMSSAQLVAQDTFMHYGGILWTNLTRAYIPWEKLVEEHGNMPKLAPVGIRCADSGHLPSFTVFPKIA